MARPVKETVDYFPHYCDHGKTLYIIEQHYGNDGYAFWFKLLELLGKTEGHYYDCSDSSAWEFLQAKTRFLGVKCQEILDKLALLGAIDRFLWENDRIIWSDNLVNNVSDAYRNRRRPVPQKPISRCKTPVSTAENPQTKLKENKLKETIPSIGANTPAEQPVDNSDGEPPLSQAKEGDGLAEKPGQAEAGFQAFWVMYPRQEGVSKAEEAYNKALATGIKPRALMIAAGKYAAKLKADGVFYEDIALPADFLTKRLYRKFIPQSRDKPPDCSKCPDRSICHNGMLLKEVPYEHGGTRSVTMPCPQRKKARAG